MDYSQQFDVCIYMYEGAIKLKILKLSYESMKHDETLIPCGYGKEKIQIFKLHRRMCELK